MACRKSEGAPSGSTCAPGTKPNRQRVGVGGRGWRPGPRGRRGRAGRWGRAGRRLGAAARRECGHQDGRGTQPADGASGPPVVRPCHSTIRCAHRCLLGGVRGSTPRRPSAPAASVQFGAARSSGPVDGRDRRAHDVVAVVGPEEDQPAPARRAPAAPAGRAGPARPGRRSPSPASTSAVEGRVAEPAEVDVVGVLGIADVGRDERVDRPSSGSSPCSTSLRGRGRRRRSVPGRTCGYSPSIARRSSQLERPAAKVHPAVARIAGR